MKRKLKSKLKLKGQLEPEACSSGLMSAEPCSQCLQNCVGQTCPKEACTNVQTSCCSRGFGTREVGVGVGVEVVRIMLKDMGKYSKSKNFFIQKIDAYQKLIDPKIKKMRGVKKICRYTPTCSNYAKQAIKKHGSAKGIALAAWRLVRCNPFSKGGRDPVR